MEKRYKLISCQVFKDEVLYLSKQLNLEDKLDISWLPIKLHNTPKLLHQYIQKIINRVGEEKINNYQAILLLYGLCGNSTLNLQAPNSLPLVISRVHDCSSLFLGSADQYLLEHQQEPGSLWFSRGFTVKNFLQHGLHFNKDKLYQQYLKNFGEEAAKYLLTTLSDSWQNNYKQAIFLSWAEDKKNFKHREEVENLAIEKNWRYKELQTNLITIKKLLTGDWENKTFLIVKANSKIIPTYDKNIFMQESLY